MIIICVLFRPIQPLDTLIDVNSRAGTHISVFMRAHECHNVITVIYTLVWPYLGL